MNLAYSQTHDLSRNRDYSGRDLYFWEAQNLVEFEEEAADMPGEKTEVNLLPILLNQTKKLLDWQRTQSARGGAHHQSPGGC